MLSGLWMYPVEGKLLITLSAASWWLLWQPGLAVAPLGAVSFGLLQVNLSAIFTMRKEDIVEGIEAPVQV